MLSNNQSENPVVRFGYSTRLKSAADNKVSSFDNDEVSGKEESSQMPGAKRKADLNLAKQEHGVKRFALGNLTNAETAISLAQKPNKVFVPSAKPKLSEELIPKGIKMRGPTKILTRAAMRLELAHGNKKKADQHMNQQSICNVDNVKENELSIPKPATATSDASKFGTRTLKDFEKNVDTTAIASGSEEQEAVKAMPSSSRLVKDFARIRVDDDEVSENESKKLKLSGALEVKHRARRSSDFEISDDSLYVSANDALDEGALSATDAKPVMFKVAEQSTKKNVPLAAKSSEAELSNVERKPIVPVKLTAPGVSTNEPKKTVVGMMEAKFKKRISTEFELSDNSLYVSAIDTLLDEQHSSSGIRFSENTADVAVAPSAVPIPAPKEEEMELNTSIPGPSPIVSCKGAVSAAKLAVVEPCSSRKPVPPGVVDFDTNYLGDIYQGSEYAQSIFEYLRSRESAYVLPDYMERQPHVTKWMRALLVDWMVEIQESFELNHETLYLGVKIVDTYLSRVEIKCETLQLVAAAALLIASKYDERVPPSIEDFVYLCDGAYERPDLLKMERTVFRTINFDLGYPLSYRFLRRYARVNRSSMPTLTLARYILETSLMEYATVLVPDSKLACAALCIALRMSDQPGWNATLEHYTEYKVNDFKDAVVLLNNGILSRRTTLNTVRQKYSHELFFQVAKRPVIISLARLFDTTDVLFQRPPMPATVGATAAIVSTRDEQTATTGTETKKPIDE